MSIDPKAVSPPRRFASWLFRPLACSPPGWFAHAPWTIRPLACSPPLSLIPGRGGGGSLPQSIPGSSRGVADRLWRCLLARCPSWRDHGPDTGTPDARPSRRRCGSAGRWLSPGVRPLACSPPGWFAHTPWTIRPLACSLLYVVSLRYDDRKLYAYNLLFILFQGFLFRLRLYKERQQYNSIMKVKYLLIHRYAHNIT